MKRLILILVLVLCFFVGIFVSHAADNVMTWTIKRSVDPSIIPQVASDHERDFQDISYGGGQYTARKVRYRAKNNPLILTETLVSTTTVTTYGGLILEYAILLSTTPGSTSQYVTISDGSTDVFVVARSTRTFNNVARGLQNYDVVYQDLKGTYFSSSLAITSSSAGLITVIGYNRP